MRITSIQYTKRKRGISTILGTLIFIGILFTSVVPMMLVMNQADSIYTKKIHEMKIMDDEAERENVEVYIYPKQDSTEVYVEVKNKGNVPVKIVRVWTNNEYHNHSEVISSNTKVLLGSFNVTNISNGTSVNAKVITERGNVFHCISGSLYYYDGGWSTTSLGICVIIRNAAGGEFQVTLINGSWSEVFYESHSKEWEDVIASTPVSEAGDYMIEVNEKKGVNWKSLPGSPIPAPITYPNGPPFIMVWIEAK